MNGRLFLFSLFLLLSVSFQAAGQKGVEDGSKYGHGQDSVECVRNMSISREFVKQGSLDLALPYWRKAFNDCPLSNKNLYIDGARIYKTMLDKQNDPAREKSLLDTLMMVYDRRIKYFGEAGNVLSRKGIDLLRYGRDNQENIKTAYAILAEAIAIDKAAVSEAALASYFSSSIILFQNKQSWAEKVIHDYLLVSSLIDQKNEGEEVLEVKKAINDNFINQGPENCDTIINVFTKVFESRKGDITFIRMLTTLLENRKCDESDIYYLALQAFQELSPGPELAQKNAQIALKRTNYNEAIGYYQQALQSETNHNKKAEYYLGMAVCYQALKNKAQSREMARKAIEIRPDWGEPILLIGQLYALSIDDCSSLNLPNSVYWIAVDYFMRAKKADTSVTDRANSLISTYSRYYPKKEEAFFHNIHEGNSYTVGCWINETTQARFND